MRQTTLSVPLEVKPESCQRLSALIETIRRREDAAETGDHDTPSYARIAAGIPTLHFMSMSVFPSASYDPTFLLEVNLDGAPGPFFNQLEAVLGPDLRDIVRCCKRPLDTDGPLYHAVTAAGSRAAVAPYLEARAQPPSVFHHGNRGLSRPRIEQERALFLALRQAAASPPPGAPYRGLDARALHKALRAALLPTHPWLAQPGAPRITAAENIADWLRLILFVVAVLAALAAPGLIARALLGQHDYLRVAAGLAALLLLRVYGWRRGLEGTEVPTTFRLSSFLASYLPGIALGLLGGLVSLTALAFVLSHLLPVIPALSLGHAFALARAFLQYLLVAVAPGLGVVLLGLVVCLRWNEMRDSSQDAPHTDERTLREMLRREDWIEQNHMGSIVHIKPGIFRSIVIRAGHLGLGLVLRVRARDGYLGSMRTVHFAHWAFLNNTSRLLFCSNFDHSWGSYLDDFIEKAHGGLTLAWGAGVGFPPTRFLVYDGASHGRLFKAWALASRAVTRFWFSAYPDLSVDQIERNHRLAEGLRAPRLSPAQATAWARDL